MANLLQCRLLVSGAVVLALWATGGGIAVSEDVVFTKVPGTKIAIVVPEGFQPADQFPGYIQADSGASILITELPAPFDELKATFTEEGFATRGMKLISSKPAKLAGNEGMLYNLTQTAQGLAFEKWIACFGIEQSTVLVTATFTEASAEALRDSLMTTVLTVRLDQGAEIDIWEGLRFRITEVSPLKISNRMSNMLMLSEGGKKGPLGPEEPFMVIGPSISRQKIDNLEAFAKARLAKTVEIKNIQVVASRAVTIANLSGYEIVATAKDSKSDLEMHVYQVMLIDESTYYLIQGLVGANNKEKFATIFESIANSFKLPE